MDFALEFRKFQLTKNQKYLKNLVTDSARKKSERDRQDFITEISTYMRLTLGIFSPLQMIQST